MKQGKDDRQLIAWLGRIQSFPAPLQTLVVACLRLRNPLLADRIALSLASQRRLGDLLDHQALRVIAPDTHPVDTLTDSGSFHHLPSRSGAAASRIGERIGPWRITRLIGSGGMGSVYEAWRDDGQYEQKVALKCIRSDLFSPEMTQAFLGERNALAKLEHRGIVPLLDGGVDQQGVPWFVMRYVEGEAIDTWCDRRHLSIRDRVTLIMQACDALSFAHRRGILHGDIKPSNLLVTPEGDVQLVDFGLSVVLTGKRMSEISGISPGYSAPESAERTPLTTAADVYSLGAVIHRVLGSEPPATPWLSTLWKEARPAPPTLDEIAASAKPDAPRTRQLRNSRELVNLLKGDLSAIASRCLAHDPDHRYPSIDALKEDLSRWLARRPVTARDGGLFHRLALLVRRQRVASALVLLLFAGAIAGAVVLTAKSRQATEEAASYAAMSGILEQTLGNATMSALGGVQYSPDAMLDQAEQQIRTLAQDKQPAVLARGLLILARSHSMAGNYKKALALVEEASHLLPDDTASGIEIQATRAALTNLAGDSVKALRIAQSALSDFDQKGVEGKALRISLLTEIAKSQWELGMGEEARRHMSEAMHLAETLESHDASIELLLVRGNWSISLQEDATAGEDFQKAMRLAASSSPLVHARIQAALATSLVGQGKFREAMEMANSQFELTKSILGDHHPLTGLSAVTQGKVAMRHGDLTGSQQAFDRGLKIIEATFGSHHPAYAHALLFAQDGPLRDSSKSPSQANAALRSAVEIFSTHYPQGHPDRLRAQMGLAIGLLTQAQREGPDPASPLLVESRTLLEDLLDEFERKGVPPFPSARIQLARVLLAQDTRDGLARAEKLLRTNGTELEARLRPGHFLLDSNMSILAIVLYRNGALEEADRQARVAIRGSYGKLPAMNSYIILTSALLTRARIASKRNDMAHARANLDEAESVIIEAFGERHLLAMQVAAARREIFNRDH